MFLYSAFAKLIPFLIQSIERYVLCLPHSSLFTFWWTSRSRSSAVVYADDKPDAIYRWSEANSHFVSVQHGSRTDPEVALRFRYHVGHQRGQPIRIRHWNFKWRRNIILDIYCLFFCFKNRLLYSRLLCVYLATYSFYMYIFFLIRKCYSLPKAGIWFKFKTCLLLHAYVHSKLIRCRKRSITFQLRHHLGIRKSTRWCAVADKEWNPLKVHLRWCLMMCNAYLSLLFSFAI